MTNKGNVLMAALLMVAIFGIVLGALGYMWNTRWQTLQYESDGAQAFNIAEAGLEYGRVLVLNSQGEKFYTIPRSINQIYEVNETGVIVSGTYNVTISVTTLVADPVKLWTVDSIGKYKSATREVFVSIDQWQNGTFSTTPLSWQEK